MKGRGIALSAVQFWVQAGAIHRPLQQELQGGQPAVIRLNQYTQQSRLLTADQWLMKIRPLWG